DDAAAVKTLDLRLIRDDGAVVYLNGTEVYRNNMPGGGISSSTFASTTIGGDDESTWYSASVSPALLHAGSNVIAVEIHQSVPDSSDISFDFELKATIEQTQGGGGDDLGLPAGWSSGDIGTTGFAGSSTEQAGVFKVTGAGSDIWGTSDGFQFAYHQLAGDGQIVVRLASQESGDLLMKAGIDIRLSLAANSQ